MTHAPLRTLLLPGLDGTGTMFRRFLDVLPPSIDPCVVEYPEREVRGYRGLESLVISKAPIDRPWAIVAESFAGPLAVRIAASSPPGVIALALVATFVHAPVPEWMARMRFLVRPFVFDAPPPKPLIRAMMAGADADDALLDDFLASIASTSPQVLAARVREVLDVDARDDLARSKVPMLYLEATNDALLRKGIADEMSALRPDLERASIDAPHLVLQTRPREAAEKIVAFLEEVARR